MLREFFSSWFGRLMAMMLLIGSAFTASHHSVRAQEKALNPVVSRLIQNYVAELQTFDISAKTHAKAMSGLCMSPNAAKLEQTRATFRSLSMSHARINVIYFGPIRTQTRLERLLFWPDPRGRGLKQISSALASLDPSVTSTETLKQKSVALQGLGVQDYLLFGRNAETLADNIKQPEAVHRCLFALASAGVIADIAQNLLAEWTGGYGGRLLNAHDADPIHRNQDEVMQKFLSSIAEALQVVGEQKLRAVLKSQPQKARPKRAPLWRSEMTLSHLSQTISRLQDFFAQDLWRPLENQRVQYSVRLIHTELDLAHKALEAMDPSDWMKVSQNPDIHGQFTAITFGLINAHELLTKQLMFALNLSAGFNSLDGD